MHIAEINIARLKQPLEHPDSAGFNDNIDRINALAERSPGFVWRYTDDSGAATDTQVTADPLMIVNASVWKTAEQLETFVFGTIHRQFYAKRAEWFNAMQSMHFAMWWVPEGHEPTLDEAMARLAHLETHGDSDHAFGWNHLPALTTWRRTRCEPAV